MFLIKFKMLKKKLKRLYYRLIIIYYWFVGLFQKKDEGEPPERRYPLW